MKRILDLFVATLCLLLLLPLTGVIAVGVRLTTKGPVLRRTPRVGQGGRVFPHYRFRTMTGDPPALTRFGRLIGNVSLDELPAIWNLMRGDVTLIGPRAARVEEVRLDDPGWQKVLSVTPGVCNPSILSFLDRFNQTDVRARIEPDINYIDQRSWRNDVKLLGKWVYLTLRMGHLKGRF
jgi:lipopolysaccharide/colanic/teichoic acid biosynthesis glycosyltransferase